METKDPRYALAFFIGILSGVFGAVVKWGWEVPFPPRNPHIPWPIGATQRVTPPKILLEQLGLPTDWSYTFSGMSMPLSIFMVHVLFSVTLAVIYCVATERWKIVSMWRGTIFGLAVYVFAHAIVMPLIAEVPPLSKTPLDEYLSEIFGHIVWLWSIEIVRCDLKNHLSPR